MGTSHGDFTKYPRTPHLFGSKGTDDDKHLGEVESNEFIADDSLIVEEKIDGTNVGIHFSIDGEMVLQCRGHLITEGSGRTWHDADSAFRSQCRFLLCAHRNGEARIVLDRSTENRR